MANPAYLKRISFRQWLHYHFLEKKLNTVFGYLFLFAVSPCVSFDYIRYQLQTRSGYSRFGGWFPSFHHDDPESILGLLFSDCIFRHHNHHRPSDHCTVAIGILVIEGMYLY